MAASNSLVERWAPRLICCSPRSAKNRFTWLIQDAEVGVKWVCQRGRLANQSRIGFVLWLEALSMMTWMSRSAGTLFSTVSRNRRNSCARWRGMHVPMVVPAFTSRAANNEVVPCRL